MLPFYGRYGVVALFFFKFFCIIYLTSYHWTYSAMLVMTTRIGLEGAAASVTVTLPLAEAVAFSKETSPMTCSLVTLSIRITLRM